jgi:hypothetical protein
MATSAAGIRVPTSLAVGLPCAVAARTPVPFPRSRTLAVVDVVAAVLGGRDAGIEQKLGISRERRWLLRWDSNLSAFALRASARSRRSPPRTGMGTAGERRRTTLRLTAGARSFCWYWPRVAGGCWSEPCSNGVNELPACREAPGVAASCGAKKSRRRQSGSRRVGGCDPHGIGQVCLPRLPLIRPAWCVRSRATTLSRRPRAMACISSASASVPTPAQNLTHSPGEALTDRRGDEPQIVATS